MAEESIIMSDKDVDEILETAEKNVQSSLDKALEYYKYMSNKLDE